MVQFQRYGRAQDPSYPSDLDFVVVTNEDLGFTANLVTGVNENFESTIPYPQEWDPDSEVCVLRKIQGWLNQESSHRDDVGSSLVTSLSYLDRSPTATFRGTQSDTEDEYIKSLFAGPMSSGTKLWPTATGFLGGFFDNRMTYGWEYVPELPLSMFFPIYLELVNNTVSVDVATGDETNVTFSSVEAVNHRYYYNIRRMNKAERMMQEALSGVPMRWAQLGS